MAGVFGEKVDLAEWIDPAVPGPHKGPVEDDSEGWNLVDLWDVWDCALCEFPIMQDIPRMYREIWAAAMAKVLRAIATAEEGKQLERSLKWFLILPKAVFRQAKRGGKAGKGLVAKRVNFLVKGDWGELLILLDTDCKEAKLEDKKNKNAKKK